MNIELESPLFPVPVRWFEIPMNVAHSGLARLAEDASSEAADRPSAVLPPREPKIAGHLDEHA